MRILSLTGFVLFFFQSLIELSAIPVLAENSFWLIPFSFSNSKILSLIVFMTLPSYSQYIYKLTLFYISISPVLYFVNTYLYIYKNLWYLAPLKHSAYPFSIHLSYFSQNVSTTSFRFYLTIDTLAVRLYTSHYLGVFGTFTH